MAAWHPILFTCIPPHTAPTGRTSKQWFHAATRNRCNRNTHTEVEVGQAFIECTERLSIGSVLTVVPATEGVTTTNTSDKPIPLLLRAMRQRSNNVATTQHALHDDQIVHVMCDLPACHNHLASLSTCLLGSLWRMFGRRSMSCMWCMEDRFCTSARPPMRALAAVGIHFQGPRMLYQSVHSQSYHGKGNVYTVARREQVHVTPTRRCIVSVHLR